MSAADRRRSLLVLLATVLLLSILPATLCTSRSDAFVGNWTESMPVGNLKSAYSTTLAGGTDGGS